MANKHFNKLAKTINELMDSKLKFEIKTRGWTCDCSIHHTIINIFININGKTIWHFPKDFKVAYTGTGPWNKGRRYVATEDNKGEEYDFFYGGGAVNIMNNLHSYNDTPVKDLLNVEFDDNWNIIPILLACDRRIGKKRFSEVKDKYLNEKNKQMLEEIMTLRGYKEAPKHPVNHSKKYRLSVKEE